MGDKIAMLLSSDWFAPHWVSIGLGMKQRQTECLQAGCRGIVEQFMSGAREYWHISFAPERVGKTGAMLGGLVKSCCVPQDMTDLVVGLVSSIGEQNERQNADFAMFALTERLRTNMADPVSEQLDIKIRETVTQIADKYDESAINWEQLCLNSTTAWDRYLRDITPSQ